MAWGDGTVESRAGATIAAELGQPPGLAPGDAGDSSSSSLKSSAASMRLASGVRQRPPSRRHSRAR